ncbi:MAG: hypothetical protein B7X90_18110 [Novosphingobium sp. 17-62-19]|uniref:hypothetical protein n=1 Tax=Novosphingobium sp. 17-62-19 TaxID=1970406 RepID=UPI000BDA7646|nr:hypothetical protein [Novosphingobium sp. 17-62-19]OYX95320.1 MAG: hypothetical protein B7Y74_04595 [Novosphingobium sp. 35-62-5]OZA16470.1 MAG: hypothetical protein B7X90_18110 [Novosphingobium sp. 17-62-19]HQS98447.1 hypothetical protein [Novosphingobium sp.]
MIEDEFQPDRLTLALLGELLVQSESFPFQPFMRLDELYLALNAIGDQFDRLILDDVVEELSDLGLVRTVSDMPRANDRLGHRAIDVALTPAGIFYCISRSAMFTDQIYGPTWDLSDRYSDLTFAIAQRFGVASDEAVPASDRIVLASDNQPDFDQLNNKLDAIISAVSADNEVAASNLFGRDEGLRKLKELKSALLSPEVRVSAVMYLGYKALFWVVEAFADKPVGALAEQAWLSLKSLLGV